MSGDLMNWDFMAGYGFGAFVMWVALRIIKRHQLRQWDKHGTP